MLLLPFSKSIVKLTMKLIPEKDDEIEDRKIVKYIDERMMETPSIALSNTVKEILRMGEKAKKSLVNSMDGLLEKSETKIKKCFTEEQTINILQKTILNYLLKLSKTSLNNESRESVDALFNTVNDIERIGDHAENIAELAQILVEKDLSLSKEGRDELIQMYNKVVDNYTYALKSMENLDIDLACQVIKMEEKIDMMEKSCRENHMKRLNESLCTIDNGVVYLDVISNLERISDHSVNIAQQVIKTVNKSIA
jgi:phosphate:Na+ symporter